MSMTLQAGDESPRPIENDAQTWFLLIDGSGGVGKTTFSRKFFSDDSALFEYVPCGFLAGSAEIQTMKQRIGDAIAEGLNISLEAQEQDDLMPFLRLAQDACDQARYRMACIHINGAE